MSIVQNTQFTGTDQEAEAGEQQYHLCLTSKSRLRATVSKASAWITGPCSRSRHTFSPYHHRVLVLLCVCVYRARTVATLPAHTGRDLSPRLRLTFFPRRVYYYSPGKVQCTSMPRGGGIPLSPEFIGGKEMDVPATFSGVYFWMEFGRTPRSSSLRE